MTPETALRLFTTPYSEQESLRHNDLINLHRAFPALGPVLMELQFRRTECERLEIECELLQIECEELRAQAGDD